MSVPRQALVLMFLAISSATWAAQTDASIDLPEAVVTAGDQLQIHVTFATPATCRTTITIFFADANHENTFFLVADVPSGANAVDVQGRLAPDLAGGEYGPTNAALNACYAGQVPRNLKIASKPMIVKSLPDATQLPNTASLSLTLSQKQFLDTKIAQLSDLNSQLSTRLEGHAADLPPLREYLAGVVQSAEDALIVTEEQYRQQIMKPQDKLPALFADFFAQYQELLIELKAPTPGVPLSGSERDAKLLYVQLKKRAPIEQLSNTWPSIAKTVWGTIKDNIAAYMFIRNNGTDKFTVAITSYPKGASIQVEALIDDNFTDYGHTDIPKATFELATWTFKFHHPDCMDEPVLRIDPYVDTQPEISAEFMHCKGR